MSRLRYARLDASHVDALERILRNDDVYRHIGGTPSEAHFRLAMARAMAGPPPDRPDEKWLGYAVQEAASGELLGRLEATIHDGFAEVAFLFDPARWGNGFATEGLHWLHATLRDEFGVSQRWATTVPANLRSQALLLRCGYVPSHPAAAPRLYSYDPGDLVYRNG